MSQRTISERSIPLRDLEEERLLFGNLDRNLHHLRRIHQIDAVSRGGVLKLSGEPAALERACDVVERALDAIRGPSETDAEQVERIMRSTAAGEQEQSGRPRRLVEPRSNNQKRYLDAIESSVLTFAIGPAGTGKSFLAVAAALSYLQAGHYRKLVLCRPAVEAGERLGFLPGDLSAKINPYLRPLYDALQELLPRSRLTRYLEEEVVEILPLAYMRGRTLDRAVIILDEAQNCTMGQMKMALTRLGENSRMIVTGDITQVDLPQNAASGLVNARRILDGIEGISFVHLNKGDIVRHPVVSRIVRAFSREEERARNASRGRLKGEAGVDSGKEDKGGKGAKGRHGGEPGKGRG